jgi:gamma-glutamylcyclotransferase (GGCT)/AIG2-like uncharacterized protein YtfP
MKRELISIEIGQVLRNYPTGGLTSFPDILDCPYRAVYGSLRMGHWNYEHFMRGLEPFAVEWVPGYILRDNGGYPAAFDASESDMICIELYDMGMVPTADWEANLDSMDRMEKGAGYFKRFIKTPAGHMAWLYVMPDDAKGYFPIEVPTGDWNDLRKQEYGQ